MKITILGMEIKVSQACKVHMTTITNWLISNFDRKGGKSKSNASPFHLIMILNLRIKEKLICRQCNKSLKMFNM